MEHITPDMMRHLLSVGFIDPDYEHFLNYGMEFEHNDVCCYIGGRDDADFTPENQTVASEGLWLPDTDQLLSWLSRNDFSADIAMSEGIFHITATDLQTSESYTGGGTPLAFALHKVIYKICKASRRSYKPAPILRLEIQQDDSAD